MEHSSATNSRGPRARATAGALPDVRRQVLEVHRVLVDAQRREYEKVHGRQSPGALFDNLVVHPLFAWLRPLTSLIAHMDEVLASDETVPADEAACVESARTLLRPAEDGGEFQRHYAEMLQREPDVAFAHGALAHVLKKVSVPDPARGDAGGPA